MKKLFFVFFISISCLALTGCLQMFPAAVYELNKGVYTLHAQSNAFGSRAALRQKLEKKAKTICKDKGFDELSSNSQITNYHTAYNMGMLIPVSTKAAIMTIKCKD